MADRPKNLIVLCSDEMRGDCLGCLGNPDIRTPHLDAFADRAVLFERHYTNHGKCVPARIAMMTGRYSHTDGFRNIHQHLPPGEPDVLLKLKERGYQSAVFGKNHCWEEMFEGYVDHHSWDEVYKPFFDGWEEKKKESRNVPEPRDLEGTYDRRGCARVFPDEIYAQQAIDYLTERRDRSRPFFLQVNIEKPHPRYAVEEPWFSMYDRDEIEAFPHGLPENAPLPLVKQREIRTGPDIDDEKLREVQAVYYGMVSKVDHLMGRMLETIEDEGLLENSIVMFWVDHGDFAGQYGLVEKWDTVMQDCIMRVPLIMHAPGLPRGVRVESLTEHVDLCPTLLELLGIEGEWGIHGASLLPVVRGERRKEAVFADGGHEKDMRDRVNTNTHKEVGNRRIRRGSGKQQTYVECPDTMARTKMVRTDRWKMIVRETGGNELYDMKADRWEMHNLWGREDLNQVVLDLQEKMIQWCLRTDTDRPYQPEVGA